LVDEEVEELSDALLGALLEAVNCWFALNAAAFFLSKSRHLNTISESQSRKQIN